MASARDVVSGTLMYEHTPVAASQASTVQGFPSLQSATVAQSRLKGSAVAEVRSRTSPTRSGSGTLVNWMPFEMS